jgi:sugar phosphate isomerase/epimerase
MSAGVEYQSAFETMRDHITHVHLRDGKYVEDEWQYAMLGEGEIDLRWVLDSLEGVGYDGTIALEYEINDIEPPETGLKKWYVACEGI